MCPIVHCPPFEIRQCEPPVALANADKAKPAVVSYRPMVTPVEEATVLLAGARREPLIVGRPFDKGRVAVFTGTVLGETRDGMRSFWETVEWRTALRSTALWVAGREPGEGHSVGVGRHGKSRGIP